MTGEGALYGTTRVPPPPSGATREPSRGAVAPSGGAEADDGLPPFRAAAGARLHSYLNFNRRAQLHALLVTRGLLARSPEQLPLKLAG